MKKLAAILVLTFIYSCAWENTNWTDPEYLGKWELVKTSGNMRNSEKTGTDMEFQETYQLKKDGSFIKTRIAPNRTTEVEGTFSIEEEESTVPGESWRTVIKMEHEKKNSIIATCGSSLTEYLYFTTDDRMVSTWNACDGMGLEYKKADNQKGK